MRLFSLITHLLFYFTVTYAFGAAIASDDASDAAYSGGFINGSNGGTGFKAWDLSFFSPPPTNSGHFIGSSSVNGTPPSGNIDTGTSQSFGMFTSNMGNTRATRPFMGDLSIGQTFSIDIDIGLLTGADTVGIYLRDDTDVEVFTLFNEFGFFIQDGGPPDVNEPNTGNYDDGLTLRYTLTSTTTYDFSITPQGSTTQSFTNRVFLSGGGINNVYVFITTDESGSPEEHLFINNLSIVPEPGTLTLIAGGFLLVALRRYRK